MAGFLVLAAFVLGSGAGPCGGAEADVRAAEEALGAGRWTAAEARLRPLASSHAACGAVLLGLARIRAARGEVTEAERLFERALAVDPGDARSHALFAGYWWSRGQAARADYLVSRALALDPQCPAALVVRGRMLVARGRTPEALEVLERAVRLDPESVDGHYELGVLFYRRLLHQDAVRELEKVVERCPGNARAHDYLALSYEALGQPDKAESAYRAASKVNEEPFADAFLDYYFGRFLLKQGRLEESLACLDRAVARHPSSRATRYERAKLGLARGDLAAARDDAEHALAFRDGGPVLDLQVYYLLATVYRRLGQEDLARKYAELARVTPIPGQD